MGGRQEEDREEGRQARQEEETVEVPQEVHQEQEVQDCTLREMQCQMHEACEEESPDLHADDEGRQEVPRGLLQEQGVRWCGKLACHAKCIKKRMKKHAKKRKGGKKKGGAKKKVPIFMQMMKGGKKCHAACFKNKVCAGCGK